MVNKFIESSDDMIIGLEVTDFILHVTHAEELITFVEDFWKSEQYR